MSKDALPHDESNLMDKLSTAIILNTAGVPVGMQNLSINSFWKSFHVFSSPFEKWCVHHWYWLLCIFYSTLLITNVLADLNCILINCTDFDSYVYYGGNHFFLYILTQYSFTMKFITNWWYNFFVIGMFLTLSVFYTWQKSIPRFFQALQQKRILYNHPQESPNLILLTQPVPVSSEEYQHFLEEYQYALLHGKRRGLTRSLITWLFILATAISLILWWTLGNVQTLNHEAKAYNIFIATMFGIQNGVRDTVYVLLIVYLAVQVLWVLAATGLYLTKLTSQFRLHIQPGHADGCGGLKFLGDFTLNMALILLVAGISYALYINPQTYSFWKIIGSIILAVLISLAYFAFFTPLRKIHQSMLEIRSTYEEIFAESMTKIEEKIRIALSEGDLTKIKTAKEGVELVQALHPDKIGYSTWPFNRNTIIVFFTPQIVPAIGFVAGLSPAVSEALKSFFSIFTGGR